MVLFLNRFITLMVSATLVFGLYLAVIKIMPNVNEQVVLLTLAFIFTLVNIYFIDSTLNDDDFSNGIISPTMLLKKYQSAFFGS